MLYLLLALLFRPWAATNSTLAPSDKPTLQPSINETAAPSWQPTYPPTDSPTVFPTQPPTDNPTVLPSAPPSDTPTAYPTGSPTVSLTNTPTRVPSPSPTQPPTWSPTVSPTQPPSTAMPTGLPTDFPTESPTESPTQPPSTAMPTDAPTDFPTESPTISPTAHPSSTPTRYPTDTLAWKATLDISYAVTPSANTSLLYTVVTSSSAGYLTTCLKDTLGSQLGNTLLLQSGLSHELSDISALYDVPIVSTEQGLDILHTLSIWEDCLQHILSEELESVVIVTDENILISSSEPTDLPTSAPTSSPVSFSAKSIGAEIADVWWIIVIVMVVCPIIVYLLLKRVILNNDKPIIENPNLAYMKMEEFEEANASLNEAPISKKRDRLTYAPVDELAEF